MTARPTLASVAERAGVSVASASRALNGLVTSPATTVRVRAAADDLGYMANALARSLKVARTEQLVLAVADVGNPVYVAMMRAIEQVVQAAGYRLLLSSTGSESRVESAMVRDMARGYADGLILSPLRVTEELLEQLRRTPVPVVVIGTLPPDIELDSVRADSPLGVGMALEHLRDMGRTRVGFVNGPRDTVPGTARGSGFRAAVARMGLDADPLLRVCADDFTFAAGRRAAAALLDVASPDAVLAANDLLAVGVMHELGSRGLRVPEDVAVVGMDDTELATMTRPTLTSVGLGTATRGRLAAQLLLERLADPERPVQRVTVSPTLVTRESSAVSVGVGGRR